MTVRIPHFWWGERILFRIFKFAMKMSLMVSDLVVGSFFLLRKLENNFPQLAQCFIADIHNILVEKFEFLFIILNFIMVIKCILNLGDEKFC